MIRSLVAAAVVVGVAAVLFLGDHGGPNAVEPLPPAPPLRSSPLIVPSTVPAPRYVVTAHRPLRQRVPFVQSAPTLVPQRSGVTARATPPAIVIPRVRTTAPLPVTKPKKRQVPTPPVPPKQKPAVPTKPTVPATPTTPTTPTVRTVPTAPTSRPQPSPPVAAPTPTPAATTPPVATPPPTVTSPTPPVTPPPPAQEPVEARPGNGYGDTNHEHSGPPGQSKKDK